MVHLRRLKINKLRDVEPTELRFADGHNFVLGKNATGKTSLLNLIVYLLRGDLRGFLDRREEIDVEMELGGMIPKYRYRVDMNLVVLDVIRIIVEPGAAQGPEEQRVPDNDAAPRMIWSIEADLKREIGVLMDNVSDADPKGWIGEPIPASLHGTFRYSSVKGGQVQCEEVCLPISPESVVAAGLQGDFRGMIYHFVQACVARDSKSTLADVLRQVLAQGLLTPTGNFGRFDESLGYYRSILIGKNAEHEPTWPLAPTFTWREGGPRSHRAVPGLISKALARALSREPGGARFELSDVEPLRQIAEAFGADRIKVWSQTEQSTPDSRTFAGFEFDFYWPGGLYHSAKHLSFGQKRLLAFLWYAATLDQAPAITDELTNGLHVDWIYRCIDAIGDRQAFHAVQNPLLVDRAGQVENTEQIRQGFVFCHTSFEGGKRRWTWRNPTMEEAELLDAALSVGIQHLSEILLNRGLW